MNRIYNVIWSKTKKCYVVVSEIVKSSGGKVKSLHTGKTYTHMIQVVYLFPLVIMHSPQNHLLWLLARLPYLVALTPWR